MRVEFEKLSNTINSHHKNQKLTMEDVAFGYIQIANNKMASAIQKITESKGFDVTRHILAVFGGAGPQHACAIAASLGITKIQVNRYSSVLSAYGLGLADVKVESVQPCKVDFFYEESSSYLDNIFEALISKSRNQLKPNFSDKNIILKKILNMYYRGTDTILSIEEPKDGDYRVKFENEYQREFGIVMAPENKIVVDSVKVVALGKAPRIKHFKIEKATNIHPEPKEVVDAYFEGSWEKTNVFIFSDLGAGAKINGPAMILDTKYYITVVVEKGCTATISEHGHIDIDVPKLEKNLSKKTDIIKISLFIHRYMAIAEQMGVSLQRTSKSVNIKERLDFSCALFNNTGGLVANAPHLPVHLGAMQHAVKYQIQNADNWCKDEVILANHPAGGGSHLPDFTVITPVYDQLSDKKVVIQGMEIDFTKPIFYVASRAHHAEIGGIAPDWRKVLLQNH